MNIPTSFLLVSANENLKMLTKPKDGHTYLTWFLCAGVAGISSIIKLRITIS